MADRLPSRLPTTEISAAGTPSMGSLTMLAVGVTVVAGLYFGRELLVPLALAVLLSFALGPVVLLLRRWRFGRTPSVFAAVAFAFLVIFGMGTAIGGQIAHLASNLPQYQATITAKIESVRGTTAGDGIVERASAMLQALRDQIATAPPAPPQSPPGEASPSRRQAPLPVEILQPDPTPFQIIQNVLTPLIEPLTTTAIVVIFVIFFLLQREDLRERFIRLAGSHDLQRTTAALDDAARRLSSYLLIQSAVNACFGLVIGMGLWLIGVPNPILWGVLAMLLRFVPYIGAYLAAAFPLVLALAVDSGWSMVIWTAALYLALEAVTGQVIEPWLYGRSTGLSAVAIVVAAAFWTWLWGPIGLLLSTPLTMCLVVLGRHVDNLEFLDVMLGDRPALKLEESFYQRILANDPDEAAYQAEEYLKTKPLAAYYDDVAIKGLKLAQRDVNRGTLRHDRRLQIKEAIDGVIDDLHDHDDVLPPKNAHGEEDRALAAQPQALVESDLAPDWAGTPVLCIAGRGALDEATAAMLVQLLGKHGIGATVAPSVALSATNLSALDVSMKLVCLCYLEPANLTNARFLVRRLRRRAPHAQIMIGLWAAAIDGVPDQGNEAGADFLVRSLREAVAQISRLAQRPPAADAATDIEAAPTLLAAS
jgi:predicted PurR-regulated permease PerM